MRLVHANLTEVEKTFVVNAIATFLDSWDSSKKSGVADYALTMQKISEIFTEYPDLRERITEARKTPANGGRAPKTTTKKKLTTSRRKKQNP